MSYEDFRGSNPVMRGRVFNNVESYGDYMTLEGTVNKIGILLTILILASCFSYFFANSLGIGTLVVGSIGAFILALVMSFAPKASPILSPVYAILEGCVLGAISYFYAAEYSGIVTQAVLLTICIFVVMLAAYRMQLIKVTDKFVSVITAATFGIALLYLVDGIISIFTKSVGFLNQTGWVGILISLVIVVVASLSLLLDFRFIEEANSMGAPKYFEWYLAFGMMVTIVWLYVEVLRLLAMFIGGGGRKR